MLSSLIQVRKVVRDLNTDQAESNILALWRDHTGIQKHLYWLPCWNSIPVSCCCIPTTQSWWLQTTIITHFPHTSAEWTELGREGSSLLHVASAGVVRPGAWGSASQRAHHQGWQGSAGQGQVQSSKVGGGGWEVRAQPGLKATHLGASPSRPLPQSTGLGSKGQNPAREPDRRCICLLWPRLRSCRASLPLTLFVRGQSLRPAFVWEEVY